MKITEMCSYVSKYFRTYDRKCRGIPADAIVGELHYHECGRLYYIRRHQCPICGMVLEKAEEQLIVHSDSKEAKKYDYFRCGEMYLEGNILVTEHIFRCPSCNQTFSPKFLKTVGKKKRKLHWG